MSDLLEIKPLAPACGSEVFGLDLRLASAQQMQRVHFLRRPFSRDPDDDMVVECAVSPGSEFIVTHNVRDFRRVEQLKVRAITAGDFLKLLRTLS